MITNLNSGAERPNERLVDMARKRKEDNVEWLLRAVRDLEEGVAILLLGGVSRYDFTVRTAQAVIRHDRTPSNWSAVALLDRPIEALVEVENLYDVAIQEISLEPEAGFQFPPETNGLQRSTLTRYIDPSAYPNLALLAFPGGTWDEIQTAVSTFHNQQAAVDGSALLLRWLGYAWGIGDNPLADGHGVPSAAMVDEVGLVLGLDFTPGLESRTSCPEAIWQAARWWHEYYSETGKVAPSGRWTAPHWLLASWGTDQ